MTPEQRIDELEAQLQDAINTITTDGAVMEIATSQLRAMRHWQHGIQQSLVVLAEAMGGRPADGLEVAPERSLDAALISVAAARIRAARLAEQQEYGGVRCTCVLTGCRAGPGCPHYSSHCKAHINHAAAQEAPKSAVQHLPAADTEGGVPE